MSRHGDTELTRLNYVLWPDESIGPHTRVDIANEAASTITKLTAQLLDAKRNEERAVKDIGTDIENGQNVLVWHEGMWKCANFVDVMGVWGGWYVTGGQNTKPLDPKPVYYRTLPPDLDGDS